MSAEFARLEVEISPGQLGGLEPLHRGTALERQKELLVAVGHVGETSTGERWRRGEILDAELDETRHVFTCDQPGQEQSRVDARRHAGTGEDWPVTVEALADDLGDVRKHFVAADDVQG
ncbi:MAG: hypothetical protein JO044_11855 [Mycobacteriaceae bacterium]|nr:hypothetical protein [Mycobacteriaceae bacterium]MBV9638659.1 hypothetical protein [Mycobacteriaceae bacterium]